MINQVIKREYQIGILEDHFAIVAGYQAQLKNTPSLNVGWTVEYYSEVEQKLIDHQTDLLILDVGVPTSPDNDAPFPILHAIPNLLEMYPDMQILVISMHNRPALIKAVKKAGASGYILKDDAASFKNLGEILLEVLQDGIYFSPDVEKMISDPDAIPSLTKRQSEILSLLASNSNLKIKELAEKLHISPSTIRNHLSDIYLKLGVNRLSAAIMRARKLGLILGSDTEDLNYEN